MKSSTERYWRVPPSYHAGEDDRVQAQAFGIEPQILHILKTRGVGNTEEIRKFLYPTLRDLEHPFVLRGMKEACDILYRALMANEQIIIWGDYDVDGVTATALLTIFFSTLGADVRWFVPNRYTHGYGLDRTQLSTLIKESTTSPVIVTVDCGITNQEEISFARSFGCKVIVVDHHEPGEGRLIADAVLNPKQQGCPFRDKNLAGVGLAFYLAMGIRSFLGQKKYFKEDEKPNLKTLLELVALGTVADMVSLTDCNRILVKAGFEVINTAPSPGISALLTECDIRSANITSEDIAFHVAPRINAAGRLASADLAVSLLLERDAEAAKKKARKLTLLNDRRKKLCKECLESALRYVDISMYVGACLVLKVEHPIGILGIVASQLTEKIGRPVILVAEVEDSLGGRILKGSCRSVPGVNIYEVLRNCKEYLVHFGGHPMAAGVTLLESQFETFTARLLEEMQMVPSLPTKGIHVDLELQLEKALTQKYIQQLQLLEPYGVGNEKPILLDRQVRVQDICKVGHNGDHLSFRKRGKFENPKCIAFQFGKYERLLKERPSFDLLYTISLCRYRNAERWQAQLVDFFCDLE